jgi:hypothetical protein
MADLPKGASFTDGNGKPLFKWQIRIRSEDPTLIEYTELLYQPEMPMMDLYKLVRRTSYMVEGPNREVWWAVDIWDKQKHDWKVTMEGKSKLHNGAGAM